jgi:methionine-rich copper-binding protein CopC
MELTRRGGVRRSAVAGAVLVLAGIVVSPAHPHAIVTKATLEEQPIVANAATPVTLHFNSRIEPGFTRVILVDGTRQGRALEVTPGQNGDTVTVQLPALTPGMYALRYKVFAVDGHVTEGMLRFRVQPVK